MYVSTSTRHNHKDPDPKGKNFDVIIVGGGICGTALAYRLGLQNRSVAMIDRDYREPHRIIGELLQPAAIRFLKNMGMDDCITKIDAPIVNGYTVFYQHEAVLLDYPNWPDSKKKSFGCGMHHGRFIQRLRQKVATQSENVTMVQGAVTKALLDKNGVVLGVKYRPLKRVNSSNDPDLDKFTTIWGQIHNPPPSRDRYGNPEYPSSLSVKRFDSVELKAPLTIFCDGIFSKYRKFFTKEKVVSKTSYCGVILPKCLPTPSRGHVFLIRPGPCIAYPIGSSEVRILIDVPNPVPSGAKLIKHLKTVTAPQLPESVRDALIETLDEGQVPRSMPSGILHAHKPPNSVPGAFLIGDGLNIRNPTTGAGMMVAFGDCYTITHLLAKVKDFSNWNHVQSAINRWFILRQSYSPSVNVLAQALYNVFAGSGSLEPMQKACFKYFKSGGICASGPIGLLSGLHLSPHILISHFFMVALYGMWDCITPIPSPASLLKAIRVLWAAYSTISPLMDGNRIGIFRSIFTPTNTDYTDHKWARL